MNLALLHPTKLILFSFLSACDLVLTMKLLRNTGGHVYESNPIAAAWLHAYGWKGLAMFKVCTIFLVMCVVVVVSTRRPVTGSRLLQFACMAVACVVIYSCSLLGYFGDSFRPPEFILVPGQAQFNWTRTRISDDSGPGSAFDRFKNMMDATKPVSAVRGEPFGGPGGSGDGNAGYSEDAN